MCFLNFSASYTYNNGAIHVSIISVNITLTKQGEAVKSNQLLYAGYKTHIVRNSYGEPHLKKHI